MVRWGVGKGWKKFPIFNFLLKILVQKVQTARMRGEEDPFILNFDFLISGRYSQTLREFFQFTGVIFMGIFMRIFMTYNNLKFR